MKIIAILESHVTVGGQFNQSLNAILQMKGICEGRFDFEVFTFYADNVEFLKKLGVECIWFKPSLLERILARANRSPLLRTRQRRKKIIGLLERKLIEHGADLVYFLTQSPIGDSFKQLNFITTVFDLSHRDTPEFPEVRCFGEFQERELHLQNGLASALLIITESEHLSDSISQRYGIDRERCLPMPMSPSPFLQNKSNIDKYSVLQKFNLKEGYFFYPAQFWSHKNHVRILEALVILRKDNINLNVAFAGSDQGNRKHIENLVDRYQLRDQVSFLGFVPVDYMRGLFEGACGVIMPTYFGPTNLPPLEAWLIGKPLIYSAHLKEHAGDAAILVNPDDASELANAMKACTDQAISSLLVKAGTLRLSQIDSLRKKRENEFVSRLIQFEARRKCWP
ncbi:MAG: glycosyltransferase [Spirochaetia bacterium]|nr:glycosyltransferase [Spirochaetia bacterium]